MDQEKIQAIPEELTKSLSGEEILKFLANNGLKCNLYTYPELAKFNDIRELLSPYDHTVILYLTKKNYGHWCCIFKCKVTTLNETVDHDKSEWPIVKSETHEEVINFFDSYGGQPDCELNWDIPEYIRTYASEDYPHLTWLLYNSKNDDGSPLNVHYNEYTFQDKMPYIATCGRHVITRLLLDKFTSYQYKNFIDFTCNGLSDKIGQKITPDDLVTFLTEKA